MLDDPSHGQNTPSRRWQKAALDSYLAADGPDFLAVATAGIR